MSHAAAVELTVLSPCRTTREVRIVRQGSTYVPPDERWVHDTPAADAIARGLADAAAGRTRRVSFAQYADLDVDND